MNYPAIDPRIRSSRLGYSFQNEQTQLRYKLYQVQISKQKLNDAIQNKKSMIGKQKQFNQKIKSMIHSKQSKLKQYKQSCESLESQILFYEQYLQNLTFSLSEIKQNLDKQLQNCLILTNKSQTVKLEHQYINSLTLKDLMGSKCKFTPQVMNYSWQIEIEQHGQQLQIWKSNDEPLYLFVYNYRPLPSKGIHHFTATVQYSYRPKFLIGVSNCKNRQDMSEHIYFNCETMQIEKNGQAISKVIGQISNQSKLTIVINCDVWLLFIILDQVLLCKAHLSSIQDQYIYLFIGLTNSDTSLKFDHSIM